MLRVRDGDAAAFETLVNRYQGSIHRLMVGWVTSPDAAEDLAQEVFLRVFRARGTYQPTARFSTWLYRIANNVASNALRDRKRRKEYQVAPRNAGHSTAIGLEQLVLAGSESIPARSIDRRERAAMVQQAVAALPERQRIALILNRFDNLSYQEIAEAMDLSVKAIKSLLSRARVNLRTLLEPYLDDGQQPAPSTDGPTEFDAAEDAEDP